MSLSINNNITALNAWRNLKQTDSKMSGTMEKLSSGLRINRAADDPAGLVISEKMRAQLTGLKAAQSNSEKAINMIGTAEASLDKVNSLLSKMRQLALDSANLGVNDAAMLQANQDEMDEAIDSITRIANNTQFGTKKLLDGSLDSKYTSYATSSTAASGETVIFQIGANENQTVRVDIHSVKAGDIGTVSSGATGVTYTDAKGVSASGTLFANTVDASTGNAVGSQNVGKISIQQLRSGLTASTTNNAINTTFQKGVFAFTAGTTVGGTSITKADAIAQSIAIIDDAIAEVSSIRGKLGAVQSDNLQVGLDSLRVSYENLQAAESTIRDTDMTSEMATFTKYQIMMQAGTAMLAQANQIPNNILQLLR